MAWFKKKRDVIDLTEHYRKKQEKLAAMKEDRDSSSSGISTSTIPTSSSSSTTSGIGIFCISSNNSNTNSTSDSSSSEYSTYGSTVSSSDSIEAKRKKLAKRLMAMTDKIEDLSNQIYHLQQRIEVLERKSPSGF